MPDTLESLRHKISRAADLKSVVRTMKAVAASSIGQYEESLRSLDKYSWALDTGLGACLKRNVPDLHTINEKKEDCQSVRAVVFGSDQGLVGQFNDAIGFFTINKMQQFSCRTDVWAVGERVYARLIDSGVKVKKVFNVPASVKKVSALVGELLLECENDVESQGEPELHLLYNGLLSASLYTQVDMKILPLDEMWLQKMALKEWPSECIPEVIGADTGILRAFIREYLFISIFRACAESLASENTSRLMAMQRAEKNITEMIGDLEAAFHELRKNSIDAELFDVIAGFGMIGKKSSQ